MRAASLTPLPRALAALLFTAGIVIAAPPTTAQPSVRLLDAVRIPRDGVDGVHLREISGVAWDADENVLWAVSDRGVLFQLELRIENGRIALLAPRRAVVLEAGEPAGVNAEGLAVANAENGVRGDSELLVAREAPTRIERFTQDGHSLGAVALVSPLASPSAYYEGNNGLEAVAMHRALGLVTLPEKPLAGRVRDVHTVFGASGVTWDVRGVTRRTAVKAIEALPDSFVVLERARVDAAQEHILRVLPLRGCESPARCDVVELRGWDPFGGLDPFEGLTRVGDNLLLVVSDDGGTGRDTAAVLVELRARGTRKR